MTSTRPTAGGPANNNGVLYQMLWTLFRATELAGVIFDPELDEAGTLVGATLVLEPPDGGDVQARTDRQTIVEQVKARPGGGPWGLSEVLHSVIPDLYRHRPSTPVVSYRFVTEGTMGAWADLYAWFEELRERPLPAGDPFPFLSTERVIAKVSRELEQKMGGACTERRFLEYLAEVVRERVPREGETLQETVRNLWILLANFEFIPAQTEATVQRSIEQALLLSGIPAGLEREKRQALTTALLEKSTKGGEEIEPKSFLQEFGIAANRLSHWMDLVERSRNHLQRCLRSREYSSERDVREAILDTRIWFDPARPQEMPRPVAVFTGESGQGKSWRLARLADQISREGLVVLMDGTGNVETDAREAARIFCEAIWSVSYVQPLSQLANLVRKSLPDSPEVWLTILVDGPQTGGYASQLIHHEWETWGVRVAFALNSEEGTGLETDSRCRVIEVPEFSLRELSKLLKLRLGEEGADTPDDVRKILRRPLLAKLYCDLKIADPSWKPSNEYQLYDRYWALQSSKRPVTVDALAELAGGFPEDRIYPWPLSKARAVGIDDKRLKHLQTIGLIRLSAGGRSFEVWHDRILNWAVAEGLVAGLRSGRFNFDKLFAQVQACRTPAVEMAGKWLGYVPLDVLWLLAEPAFKLDQAVAAFLSRIDRGFNDRNLLKQIFTLGPRIVPHLFARLAEVAQEKGHRLHDYVGLIVAIDDPSIPGRAIDLLKSEVPRQREAGVRILAQKPSPEALDLLWELLRSTEPERPDKAHEINEALRACVPSAPRWLEKAIREARPADPVDLLVYLLIRVSGGKDLWSRLKESILSKVTGEDEHAIVVCIEAFRDEQMVEWLRERVNRPDHRLAPAALRALRFLGHGQALVEVEQDEALREIAHWGGLWLPGFLAEDRKGTLDQIFRFLRSRSSPWEVAYLFDGRENQVSSEILDLLLDSVGSILANEMASPSSFDKDPVWSPLSFLSRIFRLDLLSSFSVRQGTRLEENLTKYLLRLGPKDSLRARHVDENGLAVLDKIGGEGFTRVINACLTDGKTHWGRGPGLSRALRRPNPETLALVQGVAAGKRRSEQKEEEEDSDSLWEEIQAVEALADLGQWREVVEGVVRLGGYFSYEFFQSPVRPVLSDEDLQPALEALEGNLPLPEGAILALGLSRRSELVPRIHSLLEQAGDHPETSLACLLALETLGDTSEITEAAFIRGLDDPKNHYVSWRALLIKIRTPGAFKALLEELRHPKGSRRSSSDLLALNLLIEEETRAEAAAILWETMDRWSLLFHVGSAVEHFAVLDREDVREFLRETAFSEERMGHAGTCLSAIRGLAQFDAGLAFDAAWKLLLSGATDRGHAVELLLKLDEADALKRFEEILRTSQDFLVIAAIGEALDRGGHEAILQGWLADPRPGLREGACIVAESMRWSEPLERDLLRLTGDEVWDVRDAASRTLEILGKGREASRLVEALEAETDSSRRWLLVDAAVELGYPGAIEGALAPEWFLRLYRALPPSALRDHSLKRLGVRQKDLLERIKKRER